MPTWQEKCDVIQEYCNEHPECLGCEIEKQCESVLGCFEEDDDVLKECYEFVINPSRYELQIHNNPYWERINALAEKQRAKGMSKYGVGLERNPAAIMERINHLQEELIDGLMYCEWIKDHLSECGDNFTAGDSSLRSE